MNDPGSLAQEPNGPTILDWMTVALVAAIYFQFWSAGTGPYLLHFVLSVPFCLFGVILQRCFVYKRSFVSPEWFAVIATSLYLSELVPTIDTVADSACRWYFNSPLQDRFWEWRLSLSLVACLLILSLVALGWLPSRIVRERATNILYAVRALIALSAVLLVLWGPYSTYERHVAFPFDWEFDDPLSFRDLIFVELNSVLRAWPWLAGVGVLFALLFSTPKCTRRSWPWTAWASVFVGLLLVFADMTQAVLGYLPEYPAVAAVTAFMRIPFFVLPLVYFWRRREANDRLAVKAPA